MTAIAIETDLRASLDELARACRILDMRFSLDFLRKNGHNRVHCCVFVASLYSHLSKIPGENQGNVRPQTNLEERRRLAGRSLDRRLPRPCRRPPVQELCEEAR